MVTCLSALTRLEALTIEFESVQSRPDQRSRRPPPQTRILLPVLNKLEFEGVNEYLEDLVAWIDAPLVDHLMITFPHQPIFDTPQLTQFIGRTPKFKTADEARLDFSGGNDCVELRSQTHFRCLRISCRHPDWHFPSEPSLALSSFPQGLIPTVEHLYILDPKDWQPVWLDFVEGGQWLELLHSFTAVKALYLSRILAPTIAQALQELVGERTTEVLPALQTLFLVELFPSGPVQDVIDKFVATRKLVGYPVAICRWRGEGDSELDESLNKSDEEEVESSYETDDG